MPVKSLNFHTFAAVAAHGGCTSPFLAEEDVSSRFDLLSKVLENCIERKSMPIITEEDGRSSSSCTPQEAMAAAAHF